ncbi:DUF927 domain-containing protein [Paraburkholderia sp. BR13439]|uniref:DUF927 domain-containing protein n=1 Tax=Paraburkholderia sp. BR13439 TaxID=3236996 RepID=UPI0034CEBAAC
MIVLDKSFKVNDMKLIERREIADKFARELSKAAPADTRVVICQPTEAESRTEEDVREWKARHFNPSPDVQFNFSEDKNVYVCISAIKPSHYPDNPQKRVYRRQDKYVGGLLALMLDDIGTGKGSKGNLPLERLRAILPPTAVVETSPNNYQCVYFLREPILDVDLAKSFLQSAVSKVNEMGGDGLKDPTRVFRLPFGVNSKREKNSDARKYADGDQLWEVRLESADYSLRYSKEEIEAAFGFVTAKPVPRPSRRVEGRRNALDDARLRILLAAAEKAGRVIETGDDHWRIDCLYDNTHANSAYLSGPRDEAEHAYRYCCSHTSCEGGKNRWFEVVRDMNVDSMITPQERAAIAAEESQDEEELRAVNALWADTDEWERMIADEVTAQSGESGHLGDVAESDAPESGGDEVSEKEPLESKLGVEPGATAEGNGYFPKAEERPCYRVYNEPFEMKKRKYLAGLYFHGVKYDKDNNATNFNPHLCSPLRILAETRDRNDSDYGILIEFKTEKGWKKWCVPSAMLVGDATDAKRELTKNGLKINPDEEKELVKYFRMFQSDRKLFSASTTGWDGAASFVLPERVIGGNDIYFQSRSVVAPYGSGGSLEGWKGMAALARGNPLLMLGISASFAGPLLKHLHVSGAGLHFFGDSSTGKSTIARAAVATWGGSKFMRTWNATANGLEGAAVTHTDTLLALDEMGQARDMRDVYEAAYALINGSGRSRAQQNGDVRESKTWRVFLMSNGEGTMSALLQQDDLQAKAGQQVRLLDVPASRKFGAFDELHGRSSGAAFSDEVSRLAAENYGWAGVAFVERLIVGLAAGVKLGERLDALMPKFEAADGQERRVARAFAMCALAGEMATEYGITPWGDGDALAAALASFKAWKSYRPASNLANSEDAQILQLLLDGIERSEDTKFSDIRYGELRELEVVENGEKVIKSVAHRVSGDRYGYWEAIKDDTPVAEEDTAPGLEAFDEGNVRRRYFLTSSGLEAVTKGFDAKRVTKALLSADSLFEQAKDGRAAKPKKVPGKGSVRMYHVDLDKVREALNG